jgi:hypothetical protein
MPSQVYPFLGGERGIRTPGPLTVNGFQDRRIRPLCHLSERKIIQGGVFSKSFFHFRHIFSNAMLNNALKCPSDNPFTTVVRT